MPLVTLFGVGLKILATPDGTSSCLFVDDVGLKLGWKEISIGICIARGAYIFGIRACINESVKVAASGFLDLLGRRFLYVLPETDIVLETIFCSLKEIIQEILLPFGAFPD